MTTMIFSFRRCLSRGMLAAACLLATLPGTLRAAEDEAPAKPTAESLDRWVHNLDADEYSIREGAMQQLLSAGPAAIEPLSAALPEGNLEVASRGVYVLGVLALDKRTETADSAMSALEKLAASQTSPVSGRAAGKLLQIGELRRENAITELHALGAEVHRGFQQMGLGGAAELVVKIEIGAKWEGDDNDLRRLVWLSDVQQLTFNSKRVGDAGLQYLANLSGITNLEIKRASITDNGLAPLAKMKGLRMLSIYYTPVGDGSLTHLTGITSAAEIKLFGTKISDDGAEKLAAALPNARIDHRRGGFLGIGCQPHDEGCQVAIIHPGSAAQKADLRIGDVIVLYEKQPVKDFENLTLLIAENAANEEAVIEVLRGEERMTKKILLGEWE
ncbi:PDZ domain-containing protein [Lignipirellula cremea]|uniref:PDZ domain-containing protein n=1 Tax=Lignipirellula cremea TaxID=2528010 RepID=A0A518DW85_9BACT|nr:PDZ domain-containing protein [Lignipirellula cremea]QDU96101.1 hypothetical protein Pla8534_39200 [Lignipirellula cremea]